jgi:hypothetical protein
MVSAISANAMAEPLTRGHKKRAPTLEDLLDAATRVFSRKDARPAAGPATDAADARIAGKKG